MTKNLSRSKIYVIKAFLFYRKLNVTLGYRLFSNTVIESCSIICHYLRGNV